MKRRLFNSMGALAVLLALGLVLAGCATASSIGGTADTHGLISKAKVVSENSQELASYSVILGLFDSGYQEYADKVQQAEAEGKKITSVTRSYFGFFTKITAFVK